MNEKLPCDGFGDDVERMTVCDLRAAVRRLRRENFALSKTNEVLYGHVREHGANASEAMVRTSVAEALLAQERIMTTALQHEAANLRVRLETGASEEEVGGY